MYTKVPIEERLKLHGYLWDHAWAENSIVTVGLMLQNTPEEHQEDLAVLIKETIHGLNEKQALLVLQKFPQYPDNRQLKAFGITKKNCDA